MYTRTPRSSYFNAPHSPDCNCPRHTKKTTTTVTVSPADEEPTGVCVTIPPMDHPHYLRRGVMIAGQAVWTGQQAADVLHQIREGFCRAIVPGGLYDLAELHDHTLELVIRHADLLERVCKELGVELKPMNKQ